MNLRTEHLNNRSMNLQLRPSPTICRASSRPPASQSTVPHFPSSLDRMRNRKGSNGSRPSEFGNRTPPSKSDTAPFWCAKPQPIRGFPTIEPMTFQRRQ